MPPRTRSSSLIHLLASLLALLPAWGAPTSKDHFQAAREALSQGDRKTAKRELQLCLQENPLQAEAHLVLASLLAKEGDLDQSIVGFQQGLTLDPDNALARYNLGTAFLERGEPVVAARYLEDCVRLEPDRAAAYNNLAKAYYQSRLPELAVATYRQAMEQDPGNRIATQNLALLNRNTGRPKRSGRPVNPTSGISQSTLLALADVPGNPATNAVAAPKPGPASDDSAELKAVKELIRDLSHVTAERRGGHVVLGGWTTGPAERKLLDRILTNRTDVLDLTGDDVGDPHRMLEVDATIFKVLGLNSQSAGHNFLRRVEVNASVADGAAGPFTWLYSAAINYEVNIANAADQQVAFLARPHLTTTSGSPATFLAGGDVVYEVSGLNTGDIKPYPFGTTLDVTPTLLRSRGADDIPRVRITVKAGRKVILPLEDFDGQTGDKATVFENVVVTSEAVLNLNQTLILTGLNQRERRTRKSGVPGLRSVPIIKYLFSETSVATSDLAIIILLTPRDPAYWDEKNREATAAFVAKRREFVRATQQGPDAVRRFREQYPDWYQLAPNRFASHFFLMENSEAYRKVSGMDLASEDLDFDLLGKEANRPQAKPTSSKPSGALSPRSSP